VGRSATVAKVISAVMHPLYIPVVVLLLINYSVSSDLRAFLGWTLIFIVFLVILPLIYVYFKIPRGTSIAKRIQDPAVFFRKHPRQIFVLAIICALPCTLLLIFLSAPSPLLASLVALLATSLALALINMFYGASYHLAAITTIVIVALLFWGQAVFPALVAIPLVGWAKYSLRQHSLSQLAVGFGVSLIISTASFYQFGLLEHIAG
jgi:hypothetical protein